MHRMDVDAPQHPGIGSDDIPLYRSDPETPGLPEYLREDTPIVGVHLEIDDLNTINRGQSLDRHQAIKTAPARPQTGRPISLAG